MNKKWLGINLAGGIYDIIGCIASIGACGAMMSEEVEMATGLLGFAAIGLILHIVGLIFSNKNNFKISGHVNAIVAYSIWLVSFGALSLPALTLLIISASIGMFAKPKDVV